MFNTHNQLLLYFFAFSPARSGGGSMPHRSVTDRAPACASDGYSSTQTTFPLAWLQNCRCPVHLSIRCRPSDDETTCQRKRKAIDTTMISTETMMVIDGWFFIIRICAY